MEVGIFPLTSVTAEKPNRWTIFKLNLWTVGLILSLFLITK